MWFNKGIFQGEEPICIHVTYLCLFSVKEKKFMKLKVCLCLQGVQKTKAC